MCQNCEKIGWDSRRAPEITGSQFGIDFYDLHYKMDGVDKVAKQFRIFSEDDELWHYTGFSASTHWLLDLLNVVGKAIRTD